MEDERTETLTRGAPEPPPGGAKSGLWGLTPEERARVDAQAVHLGRFLPLGMIAGGAAGVLAGWLTHRFGICIPIGIALGILLAGTLPLLGRRS